MEVSAVRETKTDNSGLKCDTVLQRMTIRILALVD